MERCPFPIVGAVNGFAINAGFEIALACDVLIASPNATFVDSHAKLGIIPSWGLSQKLPRIVGANVARLTSLACRPICAQEALRHGLVNEIVAEDRERDAGGFAPAPPAGTSVWVISESASASATAVGMVTRSGTPRITRSTTRL